MPSDYVCLWEVYDLGFSKFQKVNLIPKWLLSNFLDFLFCLQWLLLLGHLVKLPLCDPKYQMVTQVLWENLWNWCSFIYERIVNFLDFCAFHTVLQERAIYSHLKKIAWKHVIVESKHVVLKHAFHEIFAKMVRSNFYNFHNAVQWVLVILFLSRNISWNYKVFSKTEVKFLFFHTVINESFMYLKST